MLDIPAIEKALAGAADPARAAGMSAYMRGQFPFLGVPAGPRRVVTKGLLPREVDWDGIFQLLDHHEQREFHYVAGDAINRATLTRADLPQLRRFLTTKSWWDTVDLVAKKVGSVAEPADMLEWAVDENLWVRRVAIIHQLGRGVDTHLLGEIIGRNLGSGEFFLDKAIGWALRDASKHHPDWVRRFVAETDLSALSRREALKWLKTRDRC